MSVSCPYCGAVASYGRELGHLSNCPSLTPLVEHHVRNPPDAFIAATTWKHSAFLRSGNGDVWRVWFGADGLPVLQRIIDGGIPLDDWTMREHRDVLNELMGWAK